MLRLLIYVRLLSSFKVWHIVINYWTTKMLVKQSFVRWCLHRSILWRFVFLRFHFSFSEYMWISITWNIEVLGLYRLRWHQHVQPNLFVVSWKWGNGLKHLKHLALNIYHWLKIIWNTWEYQHLNVRPTREKGHSVNPFPQSFLVSTYVCCTHQ